ncbi:Sec23-binding domain of Sec16-domain-containing protein [Trametes elegans]|nr:Sec23-binding domain of Sec16-domain-containing protein [Trametes elegans]
MTTAGEAASLFGAPDPALDPFAAALGGDDTREHANGNGTTSDVAADLFGSASGDFPVGDDATASAAQAGAQQPWYDSAGQQNYAYDTPAATTNYAPPYPEQPSYSQQNGTYSQYSQYGYTPAVATPAYEPGYTQQQQSYAPAAQAYSAYSQNNLPYAPATTVQPAPPGQTSTYSASTYEPYKPKQTKSAYDPPAPAAASTVQSVYDPYKPSHAPASSAYEAPSQGPYAATSHTATYAVPPVAVPPPPAPLSEAPPPAPPAVTVAPYRPKTSNAYDPPLPPLKVAKHVPPRPTYNTPPPMSPMPPPRSTQPLQPPPPSRGPPRTPDPYAPPPTSRRDTHPPPQTEPSQPPTRSAYDPPLPNGSSQTASYTPSHNHVSNGAAYGPYAAPGPYPEAHASAFSNGTYSGYTPSSSQPDVEDIFPGAGGEQPEAVFALERVASPPRGEFPDPEGTTPQAAQAGFTGEVAAPTSPPSSPPRAVRSPVSPRSTRSNERNHVSPVRGEPSSPERSISPPKTSSVTGVSPPPRKASSYAYDPYAPAADTSTDRAKSPGASSVRSVQSTVGQPYGPPKNHTTSIAYSPPLNRPLSSQSRRSTLSSQYEPQHAPDQRRAASPAVSVRSVTAPKQGLYDPYAPSEKSVGSSPVHGRSTSNGSAYSTTSVPDPYAPPRYPARQPSEHTYSSFALPPQGNSYGSQASTYDRSGGQVVTLAAPVQSSYAPSPSLLGTNDPLGRTSARVPVVSFGFSGKLVTCFHGASMNTGFDVALSARQSTDIKIHSLTKVIPESALDTSAASYPGPLFSDPGSPTASLVRTGATQLKTKKARVVKYLEERAEEIKGGLGYHRAGSVEQSRAEAKRVLVLLLKAMVENDGRLSGSAEVDAAVRAALVPDLDVSTTPPDVSKSPSGLVPATSSDFLTSGQYGLGSALPNTQDHTIATTVVRSSHLDKIQALLAKGDRRGACHYAADEKLWPHALIIASSIDKDTWKEVVTEWIRAELAKGGGQGQGESTERREALRVAYSLFCGNGAASVQELVAPSSLIQHPQTLQIPQPPQMSITPLTPSFPAVQPLNIAQEVLADWAKTAAMMLSNPMTTDASSALTALGDQLSVHQWVEAAHACYLLSPQTSPLAGLGNHPRLTLLGGLPAATSPMYYKDPDPIIFSEIAEFAMSLATPAKGQEAFVGLPHLQPYRLLRAVSLAEIGHVQLANRYCDAISACLTRGSPYLNVTFVEQLKGLSDRLTAAPQLDKSGSWIPGKVPKPSLDSIGNWLEGRFTKFIAGESDSPLPEEATSLAQQQSYSGPFANYSSISSATTSAQPSPHQSVTDLTEIPNGAPPPRTGSTVGGRPPSRAHIQISRASSAMDYSRPFQRTGSPIARVASASAATFADAAHNGHARGPYGNGYAPSYGSDHLRPEGGSHADVSGASHSKPPSSNWGWGVSESDASTPTASTFVHLDEQPSSSDSNSGFISLMDDPMLSMTPTATKQQGSPLPRPSTYTLEEEEDDLGLGNSSFRPKKAETQENGDTTAGKAAKEEETPKPAEAAKPEIKPSASSGWLSRLWKRGDTATTPAPVKANLGEESSFYYDKELKRWVNKNAPPEAAKPAAPPPPPRAQTASPGRSFGTMPPPSPMGPPPARPATAHPIDITSEPPRRAPPRVRSNLVPSDADGPSTPPSPMPPSGTPPPPAGRARPAAKRNVRSRYVDVFAQEGSGASS